MVHALSLAQTQMAIMSLTYLGDLKTSHVELELRSTPCWDCGSFCPDEDGHPPGIVCRALASLFLRAFAITQGGHATAPSPFTTSNNVMRKDFDASEWSNSHDARLGLGCLESQFAFHKFIHSV
jgi:hypothetical protein